MKKQTKQLLIFGLAILLVILWIVWPRSLEKRISRDFPAADFSAVEWFNVRWTPPNAVKDYEAGEYPHWALEEDLTQPILDILQRAKVDRRPANQSYLLIGEQGIYDLSSWCFHVSITEEGLIRVWNTTYHLDKASFDALWAILTESNPEG